MSRIKLLRKKRGYTQAEMETLTGIPQNTYSEIESGKRPMSADQCVQIALALNTSTDYLLGLTDQIVPHKRRDDLKQVNSMGSAPASSNSPLK